MKLVLSVVLFLLSVGLMVTYQPAMAECGSKELSFCVAREMVLKMPSWIGSFCGVFVSATLAYQYSIRKQKLDDENKRNREDLLNANKTITLLSRCFGDVGKVKMFYCGKLKGMPTLDRGLLYSYMLRPKFNPVKFDPTSIYFLMTNGSVPERSPKNPNYIYNVFERFNTIMATVEVRNDLALEIHEFLSGVDANNMDGTTVTLDFDYLIDKIGFHKFTNFLVVTETQIQEIDKLIEELSMLMYELPFIFDKYFKALSNGDNEFGYRLASFDPNTEANRSVLEPMNQIDITSGVNLLRTRLLQSRKDWRPDSWITL